MGFGQTDNCGGVWFIIIIILLFACCCGGRSSGHRPSGLW